MSEKPAFLLPKPNKTFEFAHNIINDVLITIHNWGWNDLGYRISIQLNQNGIKLSKETVERTLNEVFDLISNARSDETIKYVVRKRMDQIFSDRVEVYVIFDIVVDKELNAEE